MGMMYFQVEEEKVDKIAGYLDKALQCLDEMREGGSMGHRGGGMGYRQGVRGTGPYGIGRRDDDWERPMGNQGGYRDPYYN